MSKTASKAKEPVTIRFKQLANGNKSIYLDIYKDGKRKYEFLKLYIIPEKTPFDKRQNAETMQAANAIKSQMIIDIANGKANIKKHGCKLSLLDLLEIYTKEKVRQGKSISTIKAIRSASHFIESYKRGAKLSEVDKDFCKGFSYYLKSSKVVWGGTISKTTAMHYFMVLSSALNFAVVEGLIETNPIRFLKKDEKPKRDDKKREFLTVEELRKMNETPASDKVKKPFLFGCFTGLRFGDIMSLCWSDIVEIDGKKYVSIQTAKTQKRLLQPIPNDGILPERGGKSDKDSVFDRISNAYANIVVSKWAAAAGINKYITFHTSRHTYATLLLTQGADLYTVSKLLGHSEIRTTQIYAEIIDKKKVEAVDLLNGII